MRNAQSVHYLMSVNNQCCKVSNVQTMTKPLL